MITKIEWIVGKEYEVHDIQWANTGILKGFIIDQCPVNWKDQSSYTNRSDSTTYLVFHLIKNGFNKSKMDKYCLAIPKLNNWFSTSGGKSYSLIQLYGIDYGKSIEELIKKLQRNYVFTSALCYDAKYKENYIDVQSS